MDNVLEIEDLSVAYEIPKLFSSPSTKSLLKHISFSLKSGEIACILGPSGCGKTTLLRAIAGFHTPVTGKMKIEDTVVFNGQKKNINVSAENRNIGMVFQDYALFPHLSVRENILFALTKGKIESAQQSDCDRAAYLLALTGLEKLATSSVQEISGGQKQRVALARALAPKPNLILFDEPFSNLDPELRERLARDIRQLLKITNTSGLFVTHDQKEAFTLGDKVGVLIDGKMAQWNTPYNVYHEPSTIEVAKFIGQGAFISGVSDGTTISTALGTFSLDERNNLEKSYKKKVMVLLRPDDIIHDDESNLQAKVLRKDFKGANFLYTLQLSSKEEILSLVPSHHDHPLNHPIGIKLEVDHLVTFSTTTKSTVF
tara:strand:+ start:16829 stop:17944 length:1116 start_codon:yes stop_codon:yes gene_type:complete